MAFMAPFMTDEDRAKALARTLPAAKVRDLKVEFVRELTKKDLSRASAGEVPIPLKKLRQSHHQLARLLARGTTPIEASLVTGHDLEYVYSIQSNPAFAELLAHYSIVEAQAEADLKGQMTSTGHMALQELTERLEEDPKEFTIGQLHATIELLLPKGASGAEGPPASPAFNIQFVNSTSPPLDKTIDGEVVDE